MTRTAKHLLREVINGSSANAYSWWKKVNLGEVIVPSDFDWYLFASEVVVNAYRCAKNNDEKSSLEWAALAVEVEEFLAKSA